LKSAAVDTSIAQPVLPIYGEQKAVGGFNMAYGLCFLSESGTGKSIAINPHLVRLLMEIDKDKVAIVFDKDLQITVDGTVALISANLQKALW
jgi:hypothetical protein